MLLFAAPAWAVGQKVIFAVDTTGWNPATTYLPYNGGMTVQWINQTGVDHTVCVSKPGTSDGACDQFAEAPLANNGDVVHVFPATPGIYLFHCTIHPAMQGSVRVGGIAGTVRKDSDGSGTTTAPDGALAGVSVQLYDSGDAPVGA